MYVRFDAAAVAGSLSYEWNTLECTVFVSVTGVYVQDTVTLQTDALDNPVFICVVFIWEVPTGNFNLGAVFNQNV